MPDPTRVIWVCLIFGLIMGMVAGHNLGRQGMVRRKDVDDLIDRYVKVLHQRNRMQAAIEGAIPDTSMASWAKSMLMDALKKDSC